MKDHEPVTAQLSTDGCEHSTTGPCYNCAQLQIELVGYTVFLGDLAVGDVDFNIPGDGKPFISVEVINLNAVELRALAGWLESANLEQLRPRP